MVGPGAKREGVAHLRAVMGLSERRACSIIFSVISIPVTCPAIFANSQATRPGPQATSRTESEESNPDIRINSGMESEWPGTFENGIACLENCSRIFFL